MSDMVDVDALDMKVLRILEDDGRASFTDIAKKLKLNESTIRKRVLALQKRRVIKKFSVELDPSKIGLNTVAIVGIDVEPARLLEAVQEVCEIPEAKYVATSTGDHMIMTEIWVRDGRELTKLISNRIGNIKGVKKICPAIILEKLKE
jgi:Lrp/AsnC family transcriptional regulator for asnA, asnC and gidA